MKRLAPASGTRTPREYDPCELLGTISIHPSSTRCQCAGGLCIMKAFVISEYAHHSKVPLTLDAPDPVLENGSDNLLIDVYSAGLNFFDVCITINLFMRE
jgi:hypothetical protein